MSISSCPRCAKQISLPSGVSDNAKVRCPLCRAEYTLAEALVHLPPLLEVIEDVPVSGADNWFDDGPEHEIGSGAVEVAADVAAESDATNIGDLDDELDFGPIEKEHDDIVMQEQDTEVEELAFPEEDELETGAPEQKHLNLVGLDEESVLDFDKPAAASASGESEASHGNVAEEEIELNFDEVEAVEEFAAIEEAPLDFGDPAALSDDEPEKALEFPADPLNEAATEADDPLDFGEPTASESATGDEIELDFGEPPAVEPVAAVAETEAEVEASQKGKKKDKKEKKKKEKAPREPKVAGKRSLVGTLVTPLVGLLIGVPMALYIALWIGPEYDFLKVGPLLAGWKLAPASFNKSKIARAPQLPVANPAAQLPPAQAAPVDADEPAAQPEQTATEPATPPADHSETPAVAAGEPPADAPATGPTQPEPTTEPADVPAIAEASSESPPTEAVAKDDAVDALIGDDSATKSADIPEEMPAETSDLAPDDVADKAQIAPEPALETDPLADAPADVPAEMPDESPAVATDAPAAAPDPFDAPTEDAKPDALEEPAEALGPRNGAAYAAADLNQAMEDAAAANLKMIEVQSSTDQDELRKVRKDFYLSLYHLADVVTFAKDKSGQSQLDGQRQALANVILEFAADQKRLDALKFNAPRWLGFAKRTDSGIMLAGKVQSVEQVGKLFQVRLDVTADSPAITVASAQDPKVHPDDEVFVLGSIVEHPADDLAGYEGDEKAVIWSGMTVRLPAGK